MKTYTLLAALIMTTAGINPAHAGMTVHHAEHRYTAHAGEVVHIPSGTVTRLPTEPCSGYFSLFCTQYWIGWPSIWGYATPVCTTEQVVSQPATGRDSDLSEADSAPLID
jgi:hypothetical protein